MEGNEKDFGKMFWDRLTYGLSWGEISECAAKANVSSVVLQEMHGRWSNNTELAEKLHVSRRVVGKLIDGDLNISFELLRKICDVFGYRFHIEFVKAEENNE